MSPLVTFSFMSPPALPCAQQPILRQVTSYLSASSVDGAVIVTTPQEVSLLDVRKEISFCRKVGVPILGVVENMSGFVCGKCGTETLVFHPSSGGAEKMCTEM